MAFNPDFKWNFFNYYLFFSRGLFPLIVLLFGYKGMWIFYFITATVLTLDITFDDFTAITVFCILFMFIPKKYRWLKVITICSYIAAVFTVATLHNKDPYHLFVHFIGCVALILTVQKLKIYLSKKKLILTNDERIILEELKKGKRQKEIKQFSENTVCNKLKEARKRNDLTSTEELLNNFTF